MTVGAVAVGAAVAIGLSLVPVTADQVPDRPALVLGVDHVPVAVADLDAAAARFHRLGFALKPGRPHDNGIQNLHAKFPDGTEIELITAPAAVDALTRQYRTHLAHGDGPAFLALFAPRPGDAAAAMQAANDPLPYVFFGQLQSSPTDRPEHFAHPNTAVSLGEVWIASSDVSVERGALAALGARLREAEVALPEPTRAVVAVFARSSVVLLPPTFQLVPERPIVGLVVSVRDVGAASRWLADQGVPFRPVQMGAAPAVVIDPRQAGGFFLAYRLER